MPNLDLALLILAPFALFGFAVFLGKCMSLNTRLELRDYGDKPPEDLDYPAAYSALSEFRLARERKAENGHMHAARAKAEREAAGLG